MDLVNKYLKLSEAWPGTPEWKKQHDPNYNPYDPEGKARKALKQQPYGYRGKSAEGEEEEKPAEQPAMKKRGRPKKVREDVQVDEAAAEKTYNYAFDKVRDMDAKNPFSKSAKRTMYTKAARNAFQRMKSSGTKPNLPEEVELDEISQNTALNAYAKRAARAATTKDPKDQEKADKSITRIGKRWTADAQRRAWNRADKLIYKEEVDNLDEKISVVPAGTPDTGIQKIKTSSGGTITTGTMARKPKPTTSSPTSNLRSSTASRLNQIRSRTSSSLNSLRKEDVQIDELSPSTLMSYYGKRSSQTGKRISAAMDKIEGKPSKSDVYNKGLQSAQSKFEKKRKEQTGMNPQKPRPAAAPAYPLGGRDPASGRSYSEEVELDEMDKSQPSSSRGAEGLPLGKKAEPVKTDKVKSDALKALQKQYKKVKEEVEIEEGVGGTIAGGVGQFIGNKIDPLHGEILRTHGEMVGRAAEYTIRKHVNKLHRALKSILSSGKATNEEVEQVDEISAVTHAKYRTAARADIRKTAKNLDVDSKASDRIQKRVAGLARSTGLERVKKMNEEEYESVPASKALQKAHDEERKKRGLPDPSYYLKLAAQKKKEIEDMKKNEETTPPFTPDKKKQMAVAGKYGKEYSTARHLARMGVQAALKDLKKGPEKGSKQV